MADSGGRSGTYDERRVPLEDSDHLAVHCVHIFMQNLYHYATQNTVRMLVSSSVVGLSTITWKRARLRTILCGFHLWRANILKSLGWLFSVSLSIEKYRTPCSWHVTATFKRRIHKKKQRSC